MVEVEIDIAQLRRDLRRIYRDVGPEGLNRATYRAMNHTILKLRTTSARYVRQNLRMKAADVKKELKVSRASRTHLVASLKARSRPMELRKFRPRQMRKGVKVGITPGKRKLINRAFIATMPRTGYTGVFARGRYVRGRGFVFDGPGAGTNRITKLLTTTVAQKLDDKQLQPILLRQVYNELPKRMSHLLGRESSFGKSPIPV